MNINFALGHSSLDAVLVAAVDADIDADINAAQGVCAITMGDSPKLLRQQLQQSFPNATLTEASFKLEAWLTQVVDFIETPTGLDLPLHLLGTDFQIAVWQAIKEIPIGTTASYAEVAERMAQPRAIRAVARACACNQVALAVPCHRVVRSDGTLSGYRWGVERKRILLAREASLNPASREASSSVAAQAAVRP